MSQPRGSIRSALRPSTNRLSNFNRRWDSTIFLITHDLDTLHAICDRVAVIADHHVIAVGTIPELLALDHPWIQEYFNGARGRIAAAGDAAQKVKS